MRVRFWLSTPRTGLVVQELTGVITAELTARLGGGQMSLQLPLGSLTLNDSTPDWSAISRIITQTRPGRSSVIATAGENILGEWLISERSLDWPADTVRLQGVELDSYPTARSIHTTRDYTNANLGMVLNRLLRDVYHHYLSGGSPSPTPYFDITVPTPTTSKTVTVLAKFREGYLSDTLRELDDLAEWRVEHTPSWENGALVSVTRMIRFGIPRLTGATETKLWAGPYGTRQGNVTDLKGSESWFNYASTVQGLGAGQGGKKVVEQILSSDVPGGVSGGVMRVVNIDFPDVSNRLVLRRLATAAAVDRQDISAPWEVTGLVDKLGALPRVGRSVSLRVDPQPILPDGISEVFRVGEVTYRVESGETFLVSVKAREE